MKEEQTINGLPEGWKKVKVNDVCVNIVGGGTPSTQKPDYWQGDIPWISSADIHGIKDLKPRRNISLEAVKNSATNILPKGGIVVVTRVGLGKLAVAPYDLCFSQDSQGLILKKDLISTEYALLVLHQEVQNFKHQSRGTTINGVTKKQLAELQIALPPLETQQQIVSKIEELFSELDKGIEELKTAQQQLKVYRQAVLKWAFEGRLTNDDVKDGELPKGWKMQRLDDIGMWRGGGTPSKANKEFWADGNILWVSPKDMKSKIIHDTIDKITSNAVEKSTAQLIPKGSILFVVRSGILRRTLPVAITTGDVTINQDLKALTPKEVDPEYIFYYAEAKNDDIRRTCSKDGTTVESIETALLKNYQLPICSIEEQQQIVQEIESRLSVCDKIEETIVDSLKQAEALRQSILKKAFEGKLC